MSVIAQTSRDVPVVNACLRWGPTMDFSVVHFSQSIASRILLQAGVIVRWRCGASEPRRSIEIQFADHLETGIGREALAFALPYARAGVNIYVLSDRVKLFFDRDPSISGRILGHVLAHEIGHILSGVAAHSDKGLMRAHWSQEDFLDMRVHLMKFTREDEQLIHLNLDKPMHHSAD
jgi:hypothetical protein